MLYTLCIVGAGATGLGLLLLLQSAGVDLSTVVIIDPYFDGGDLARKWGPVQSNTPWSKTAGAIRAVCPELSVPDPVDPNLTTPLAELARLTRSLAAPALKRTAQILGTVNSAEHDGSAWTVAYTAACQVATLCAKTIVLAPGAEPRSLNLPLPSIPLECALDKQRLALYVQPGQHVAVFGTMHSGTLVMRNLYDLGAITTAFYNSPQPFVWDRDGAYDGIKEEAAAIADAIVAGTYADRLAVKSTTDSSALVRAALEADWVIYAMGFHPRCGITLKAQGELRPASSYDGATGAIHGCPGAWGFGTAYPNRAPDGVHWDVSIAAFLAHMNTQLPAILAAMGS